MSTMIDEAVAALSARITGSFDGVAKFVIPDQGAIMIDRSGVRAADDDAQVTLTASADTFRSILDGDLSPTLAFMTGKLSVDGDMGLAMKLGSVLS